jgi:hypothetical protein
LKNAVFGQVYYGGKEMETITQFDDNCIIVGIPRSIQRDGTLTDDIILTDSSLYESVRRCWRASLGRASRAKYLIGTIDVKKVDIVVEIHSCDYVKNNYCDICRKKRREERKEDCEDEDGTILIFEGDKIKGDTKYLNKEIPEDYRPGQNPVRYTYT